MIKNYLKIAFRNLWRHKAFSLINILGLTVGMSAFFLIFLYVNFEWSYDAFHTKADRIYRVVSDIKTPTETINADGPSWAVGPHLKGEFSEVESVVRTGGGSLLVRKGDIKFQEENSLFADSDFFKMFDFHLIYGNPKTALREPLSIVFSESAAKKYFGKANPVGQTLLLTGGGMNAIVTGVMKDLPENSIIKADMLVSMTTMTQRFDSSRDNEWGNYGNRTYVLLKPGTNPKALETRFPAFLEKLNGREMKESKMVPTLFLEPIKRVYLYSTRDGSKSANIGNVITFAAVAIFILLIACFNFVNLTTARSTERAKEVGVRKVVGALRTQLARQFIGESIILCLIAWVLTLGLTSAFLPAFNRLSGKVISPTIFSHPIYIFFLLGVAVVIGILAGAYPALVLSSFQPVSTLKGRFSSGARGSILRRVLVILQFTISITLMIGTVVVYTQMKYMRTADLGFDKDQKLIIDTHGDPAKTAFRNAVAMMPNIRSVAMAGSVPGGGNPGAYSQIENVKGDMQIANLDLYFVDFDYLPQYKMKVLAGRIFNGTYGTDTTQAMVVNEAAVKMFGYTKPSQIIGKKFDQWGRRGTIIGVLKDFHYRSLQEVIKPLSIRIEPDGCDLVSVNVAGGPSLPGTLATIEKKWKELVPARPFSYFFLDEFFDKQYRKEDRFQKLFLDFAVLAIMISCLGLLGLASYSTLQRTKEIGIRKVLGASVGGIVTLLSKEFVLLVAISFLIGAPIAGYFMVRWLRGFYYRTSLDWWMFAIAGVAALCIALLTVSFQAIRAAVANPVTSLRTE